MNRQGGQIISCPPAPSAPPTSVSTSDVTSSSITVQWGAVDCIHRNGDITGYSVRYGVQGSADGNRTVVMASGDSIGGLYVIFGLSPSTTYTIEVAAVTSAGTGVYSDPLPVDTPPGESWGGPSMWCTLQSQHAMNTVGGVAMLGGGDGSSLVLRGKGMGEEREGGEGGHWALGREGRGGRGEGVGDCASAQV